MSESRETAGLSRGEVETLCILSVVGVDGCPTHELAPRLGLSRSLAVGIAHGMAPLVGSGLLLQLEDMFYVSDAGAALLRGRLRALGVT